MSIDTRRRAPWIACVVAAALAAATRAEVERVSTEPGSGITIEIEGWAGIGTPASGRDTGLVPLEVTITNGSPGNGAWRIGPDDRFGWSLRPLPTATLTVPAGGTGRATLFLEMGGGGDAYVAVQGPGVAGGTSLLNVSGNPTPPSTPEDINASRLARGQSKRVLAARAGRPADRDIVPLDMGRAPTDWRGWSAFRKVMITADDWRELSAAARKAALDWVTLGGHLVVFAKDDAETIPGLPRDGEAAARTGRITIVPQEGEVILEHAVDRAGAGPDGMGATLARYHGHPDGMPMHGRAWGASDTASWDPGFGRLAGIFGPRTLPVGAILTFLAVFGLVAGPLNVWVLAGPGRRSRMFWTTPAISLAATALLLALMFLRDGVGGAGARRTLALLDPGASTMAVIQEQFSRTGVLFGSSFPIREPSWMHPLAETSPGEPLIEADGAVRSGGWFRSRSDQAFLLQAARPSRARIEFVPRDDAAGLPTVVSSVDVPLVQVFVIDGEGLYWRTIDVGTGERKALQPTDRAAYEEWFDGLVADAGPVRRAALVAVRGRRECAYAETDGPAKLAIATLPSIRWGDDRAVVVCPVTAGAAP